MWSCQYEGFTPCRASDALMYFINLCLRWTSFFPFTSFPPFSGAEKICDKGSNPISTVSFISAGVITWPKSPKYCFQICSWTFFASFLVEGIDDNAAITVYKRVWLTNWVTHIDNMHNRQPLLINQDDSSRRRVNLPSLLVSFAHTLKLKFVRDL